MLAEKKYYPDTTVWVRDFSHHMGDPMMEYYWIHPAFDDYPLVGVTYKAAKLFCKWRTGYLNKARTDAGLPVMPNFRLPSEAEWEYAARGGKKSNGYKYSGSDNLDELSWYFENSGDKPHPVAGKKPNELGIYDMSGNVIEWCNDWYEENLGTAKRKNPQGPKDGEFKVQRGGAYNTIFVSDLVFMRSHAFPTTDYSNMGFRLALSAE
jgi:formylglycine-generating enzyme required for sulfatase activity